MITTATTTADAVRASQDQFLNAVRQSQHVVTEAVSRWATAVGDIAPAAPVTLPRLEALPRPEAVVESTFDFAQKLLDAQRDFARGIVAASAPVRRAA